MNTDNVWCHLLHRIEYCLKEKLCLKFFFSFFERVGTCFSSLSAVDQCTIIMIRND